MNDPPYRTLDAFTIWDPAVDCHSLHFPFTKIIQSDHKIFMLAVLTYLYLSSVSSKGTCTREKVDFYFR